ncbi:folate family ECF transporter S component [Eupransor demetentiae]|uniref:Membrane (S) component (ECF-S) n=1 Tax=Eupransor demetentiae TaxID=3109584 RepID=A0ABM9N7K2_9LACO|nr:ECF-type riboflavin transporter [Lactobacillaceae bacterium LMG 33000]
MNIRAKKWVLPKLDTRQLVLLAFLMALSLILGRFGTVSTQFIQVGFTFVATSLIARWYGPIWAVLTASILDVVKVMLMGGQYFIGFTVTAAAAALIYGWGYYRVDKISWLRVAITVALVTFIVNLGLNTINLILMYQPVHSWSSFWAFITPRFIKNLTVYPIQVLVSYFVLNNPVINRLTKDIF